MSHKLEIRILPMSALIPAPYNPRRKPSGPAYQKLRASLETFGLVEPLVWNERTGHVVGGHFRLNILQDLGHTEAPVSVVNLTDAEEKALNVVLNNAEAQGRYDPEKLAGLLEELQSLPELEMTGFDESTLATLRYMPAVDGLVEEPPTDQVEVTLITDSAKFAAFESRLDELVREYDLETHIRRG